MSNSIFNVSIIIPTFNSERYLKPAIESVLNQTMKPFEIIVIDDGSTLDNTISIASTYIPYGVQVITREHKGLSAARNTGVKHATGNYLAFLDSDDLWEKEKLEKQISLFHENARIQAVICKIQQFVSPDIAEDTQKKYHCPATPQAGYLASCLLITREAFFQVGLFKENLVGGEFIEWYIRAKHQALIFAMHPDTLMHRRIHGNNTSLTNIDAVQAAYLNIIRMKLKNDGLADV